MAGQEGSEKELWMSGCLVPCTGRHTPVEEEDEEEVVLMSKSMGGGRARPIRVRHGPAAKEEKVTVTGAKRKAERSLKTAAVPSVGWKAAAAPADASRDIAAAAASADASMKAAVDPSAGASMKTATGDGDVEILDAGWVMMPEDHVRWILAQKREKHAVPSIELYDPYRTEGAMELTGFSQKNIDEKRELFSSLHASLVASHKDFFEYQEWVRSVYEANGRVLVPKSIVGPKDAMQKEINDAWAQFKEEYARDHADDLDAEGEDDCPMDDMVDSNTKEDLACN